MAQSQETQCIVDIHEQQSNLKKPKSLHLRCSSSAVNFKSLSTITPSVISDCSTNTDITSTCNYTSVPTTDSLDCYDESCSKTRVPGRGGDNNSIMRSSKYSEHVNLSFCDINYTVKTALFSREEKCILKNVSGDFLSGELTAIMGPSGAGKSTLLDILSGYTYIGVQGRITINGLHKNFQNIRKESCYIMQNDNLQPLLTVEESMSIAACLKLPKHISKIERDNKVETIISDLGLQPCRRTQARHLSGGQRKRLAVGLELIQDPPLMFFDEPLSGLDSCVSKQCLSLLKDLAREGRTIICTIHQPSAILLEMFDHLYVVTDGSCIYQGSVKGLIPYLNELNLHCPTYHNPADFVLEICQGQYGDRIDDLVMKSENGKNSDWRKKIHPQRSTTQNFVLKSVDDVKTTSSLLTPIKTPILTHSLTPAAFTGFKILGEKTKESFSRCKRNIKSNSTSKHPISFCRQFFILLYRTFLILSRDRFLTYSRLLIHLIISLCIGTLYYRIGDDATYMLDNCNYLFFSIMFLMFTAFSSMTLTFPLEIPILNREHFNGWYSLKSYYLAITLADMPVQILSTIIYVVVTFYLTAQPLETFRFFLFLIMCIIVSFVSQSVGVLCGICLNVTNVTVFGPFFLCPFLMFSGFFIHFKDAHPWVRWLFHTSFIKHAFEGLMLSIFGYDRPRLPCSSDYCHFISPSKFLDEITMPNADYLHAVLFLVVLYFVLRTVSYFILKYRLHFNRAIMNTIRYQITKVCKR